MRKILVMVMMGFILAGCVRAAPAGWYYDPAGHLQPTPGHWQYCHPHLFQNTCVREKELWLAWGESDAAFG